MTELEALMQTSQDNWRAYQDEHFASGDGVSRPPRALRPPVVTAADLRDILAALLGMVDVVERIQGKPVRTAEMRKAHRDRQRDEKRGESLTVDAECGKL